MATPTPRTTPDEWAQIPVEVAFSGKPSARIRIYDKNGKLVSDTKKEVHARLPLKPGRYTAVYAHLGECGGAGVPPQRRVTFDVKDGKAVPVKATERLTKVEMCTVLAQ